MKIAFVIHSLGVGGAEIVVTNYLIKLKEKGNDVVLIEMIECNSFLSYKLENAGITIVSLFHEFDNVRIINKALDVAKFKLFQKHNLEYVIQRLQPDVVHFHTNIECLDRMDFNYKHSFYTFHTAVWRSINYPSKKFKQALTNACKKGMEIIAISEDIKREAIQTLGQCSVMKIPNGIDIKEIRKKRISKEEGCRNLDIPVDAFVVGHVGRFHEVKNHEKLLHIFREISELNKQAVLVLVGDGDRDRVDHIKQLAKELNIFDKIKFTGLRSDAHSVMSIFDCFLLPSHAEGFPLVLAEAQALGVRCIASDVVPDEVIINDNCFVLSISKEDAEWAKLALDDSTIIRNRDIRCIDINYVIERHIIEYQKTV